MNNSKIPTSFIDKVLEYNTNYFNHQVQNIEKTLKYIEWFKDKDDYENTQLYKKTIDRQVKPHNWCRKYKCKINFDSEIMQQSNIPQQMVRHMTGVIIKTIERKSVKVI